MLSLSVSRAQTFEECRRKFKYQYIDKLPTIEANSPHLVLGSFVHKVLEHCIRGVIRKQPIKTAMLAGFKQARNEIPAITSVQLQELKPWLQKFVKQCSNNDSLTPLGVEKKFKFTLNDQFLVRGYVDRVDRDENGVIHIVDYKTSRSTRYLSDFQLGVYAAALRFGPYKKESMCAWYSMVRFGFKQEPVGGLEVTPELIDESILRLCAVGEAIKREQKWSVNRSGRCHWCDFFQQCHVDTPIETWT